MTIQGLNNLLRGLPLNTEIYFAEPGLLEDYMSFARIDIENSLDDEGAVVKDVVFRFSGPDGN